MAESWRRFLAASMRQIVRHHEEGNPFAAEDAAHVLDMVMKVRGDGDDLPLDPEFMRLVSAHMRGSLPKRQGRKVPFDDWSNGAPWLVRNMARAEFAERRAEGEKYDALIAEFASTLRVSHSTVEGIVSPKKSDK